MKELIDSDNWGELYEMIPMLIEPVIIASGKHGKNLEGETEKAIELALAMNLLLAYFRSRKQAPTQQDHELFQARVNHNFESLSKEITDALDIK